MHIGLISDTHGVFDRQFRDFFEPVDEIWHAGDFGGGLGLAEEIAAFKPLKGVAGNCDNHELRFIHPLHRVFECEGLKILMMHIGGYPGRYDVRARELIDFHKPDVFICGHSHILKVMWDHELDVLHVNPGAAGYYGWQQQRTLVRLIIDNGTMRDLEIIELGKRKIEK